jgi:hypothetical protein
MIHKLPPIEEVSSDFSGAEAFAHGSKLFARAVELDMGKETQRCLETVEYAAFKLAMQVQLGGLSLLGTKKLDDATWQPVPLACFAVDHLLWGFIAATSGQVRVAFTLVRAAVEASIFEAAAALQPETFRKKWNTRHGTGGAVLRELKGLSPRVSALLQVAWDCTVEYGHASHIPVLTSVGNAREKGQTAKTISFAGQYVGPLDAKLLDQLVRVYALSAFAACEAMNVALRPHMRDSSYWSARYEELIEKLHAPVPLPEHLRASWSSERGAALSKKLRGDA